MIILHSIIKKYLNHIKHFEIRKDKNMYEAINYGFKLATGDIFSWLNSDDLYHRNCLSPILKHMNRKNYNWVNCRSSTMKDEKVTSFPIPFYFPQKYIANGKCHKSDYGFIPQESLFFQENYIFLVARFLLISSLLVIIFYGKKCQSKRN